MMFYHMRIEEAMFGMDHTLFADLIITCFQTQTSVLPVVNAL